MKEQMSSLRIALFAASLAAGLAGCGAHEAAKLEGDAGPVVAVQVREVESRRFDDAIEASGAWRSAGDVVMATPFAASVESLSARPGDAVEKGQRLGWLVTRESSAALRGAELLAHQAGTAAEREDARRALELARRDLVRVPIIASRSGLVTHRGAEIGAELAEGAEVLTLVPRDAIVCEVHVGAAAAARVRPGQRATLGEEGSGETRRAVVQRVLPMASSGDQTTLVWLAPEAAGPAPALDRFVTATIEVGEPRIAFAVPDSAVVEDDLTGETRVAVVGADSFATWTAVVLGGHAGGWRELKAPALPSGTRVIVVGQHGLPDRTRVTPAP